MRISAVVLSLAAVSFAVGGCCCKTNTAGSGSSDMHHDHGAAAVEHHHESMWASVNQAVAVFYPTKGNTVSGTIYFDQLSADPKSTTPTVHIHGSITGLEPNSTHALHIHEFGDQTSSDGMSTGGHYNPDHHQHGAPTAADHHAGDFGNLTADASGTAILDLTVNDISVAGLKNPIIGRGVVLHAKVDDFVTQPTGNAGGRIAVAVIGIAKPKP